MFKGCDSVEHMKTNHTEIHDGIECIRQGSTQTPAVRAIDNALDRSEFTSEQRKNYWYRSATHQTGGWLLKKLVPKIVDELVADLDALNTCDCDNQACDRCDPTYRMRARSDRLIRRQKRFYEDRYFCQQLIGGTWVAATVGRGHTSVKNVFADPSKEDIRIIVRQMPVPTEK